MNASQGREPARPQQGNGAGAAKNTSAAAQPRLSREAVVAFVLLPVLLAAGFFLGGRLLGEDSPTTIDAAPVDTTPGAEDPAAPVDDPSASPSEVPPVIGPPAPSDAAVSPEPTEAAPSPEPTEAAPSAEPTEAAPSPEPTEAAPSPEPTEAAPSPEPTEAAPSPEPTEEPTEEPTAAPAPPHSDPSQPTVAAGIPQPTAGNSVLLFRGAANDDIRTWQARMVERGWDLQVDGIYGERSAQVARSFQSEKGLSVDGLVGPETWSAAWTAPIT